MMLSRDRKSICDFHCKVFFICSLCMVLICLFASPVEAEIIVSGTCGVDLSWTLHSSGSLVITGTGAMNYYSYNSPAPWYSQRARINNVTITDSVTSIGSYAFCSCSNLTSVSIPDSVTSIGSYAFYYCSNLTSVSIPGSVTSIGSHAFSPCSSLTSIDVNAANSFYCSIDGVLFNRNRNILIQCPGGKQGSYSIPDNVTFIGSSAFSDCTGLTSISIPGSVTSIGSSAFSGCWRLTSISIPGNVTSIESGTFSCSGLTGITIPCSVTSIGSAAFELCSDLTSITIPSSVTSIGNDAFIDCPGFRTAGPIGGGYDYEFGWSDTIPDYAFSGCTGLASITIPSSVTSIGSYAFCKCDSLTSITIPSKVINFGSYAFSECYELANITIPSSVTSIGDYAFSNCNLETVQYSGTVDQWRNISIGAGNNALISAVNHTMGSCGASLNWTLDSTGTLVITGTGAMSNYSYSSHAPWYSQRDMIKNVTIPDNVTSIGSAAFSDCTGLTSISMPGSVTSIGSAAFSGCTGLTSISIPGNVTSIESMTFFRSGLTGITIPSSVTSIGYSAFEDCHGLTSITIPSSVTCIEHSAFHSCLGLTSIAIPSSVTSIGVDAFANCTGLTSITIPSSVTCIGGTAFDNCTGLKTAGPIGGGYNYEFGWTDTIPDNAFYGCWRLTSITIPSNVTSIGAYAFNCCYDLTIINIPNSVTSIGDYAFDSCYRLMSVSIPCGITYASNTFPDQAQINICHKHIVEDEANAPTCDSNGKTAGSHCDDCGEIIQEQTIIDALGHQWNTPGYTWSADKSTVTAKRVCRRDASHLETETVNVKTAVTKPATCAEEGQTTYTSNAFTNSAFAVQIKTLINIDALGHDWGAPDYTWSADNGKITAKRICSHDADHVETETVNVTSEVTKPATCTENGQTTYTSSMFANNAFSVQTRTLTNISALGHQWNTSIYNWSADNTLVTAKRICAHDASHIETEIAGVKAAITKPATCTEKGQTTYTSSAFANDAFAVQTKTLTDINALGHDWGAPVYTWFADNSKVAAKRICSHDSEHIESETVNVAAEMTKPATCTENGQTTYTSATFMNNAFSVQTKTLRNINSLGHTIVTDSAVAPTNCRSGLTEGSHCSVCGEVLTAQQTVHPLLWEIDETGGQVMILRYYGSETNVTVPSSFDGLPVRVIASGAFPYSNCPIRIFIPNSVQSISNTAFGRSITVYCHEYSEADYWADEVDYTAIYVDNTVSGTFYRITMPLPFTMEYGETRNLGAMVWPLVGNDTITVTSSDPSVMEVNGETLTAKYVGQAVVTLTAGGKSSSVVVTVHATPIEYFIEDERGETNDTYYVVTKATKQLSVNGIRPIGAEMTITWTSSNESVAIVNSTGEITAKRPGQVVITATAQNGLSRSCKIIVCYPVSEISFEQNFYNIPLGGRKQIRALVFTLDGDYVNQLVSFTSSDETIAIVDQHGIIKALKCGSVMITATAANGITADCTLVIQAATFDQNIFSLPTHLTAIETEAFANLQAVKAVRIPAGVKFIANDAFAGSNMIVLAPQGSYVAEWALNHGMTVIEE